MSKDAKAAVADSSGRSATVTRIAPGVYCVGPWGRSRTTTYVVQAGDTAVLVDTGYRGDADRVDQATRSVLGGDAAPAAILLTHVHPDHSGAARELSHRWHCPVYLHAADLPIAMGDFAAMHRTAGPLDRWIVLPVMRAMGRRRRRAVLDVNSLHETARTFSSDGPVPHLPAWQCVPTPGHTPGHVSYFRPADRVLISGDALVNVRLNHPLGLLRGRPGLSGPPWYTTWNPRLARDSVRRLAALQPAVLAAGHGTPLTAPDTAARVEAFARHLPPIPGARRGGRRP